MAESSYLEEKIVLAWARRNVPGTFAHATMVLNCVNSDGLCRPASHITQTCTKPMLYLSAGCWDSPVGITNRGAIQIVTSVKELWLCASEKICVQKVWNTATRTYGLARIVSNKDNMGQRLLRLLKKPKALLSNKALDKIFIPRGAAPKLNKRPSPPVRSLTPYPEPYPKHS